MSETHNPSLRELLGSPVALPVGDAVLQVRPMGWYQASEAIEHVLPLAETLPQLMAPGDGTDAMERVLGVVMTFRDEITAFLAVATALPPEDVRALPPAAAAELLLGVLEVNADFFVRSLPVLMQRSQGRLQALKQRLAPAVAQALATAPPPASTMSSSA